VVPMLASSDTDAKSERLAPAAQRPTQQRTAFVPVLLGTLALLLGLGWQSYLLMADRDGLQTAHAGQQQTVDNAGKLRTSLDTLAADTQRLADSGNASAALLVTELRKRGITINTAKAGAVAEPAAKP
jgi:hypothetical protein